MTLETPPEKYLGADVEARFLKQIQGARRTEKAMAAGDRPHGNDQWEHYRAAFENYGELTANDLARKLGKSADSVRASLGGYKRRGLVVSSSAAGISIYRLADGGAA